jgi:hypothetical protein
MAAAIKSTAGDHSILFRIFDGQPYTDLIWKRIRPEYVKAFVTDDEG